MKGLDFFANYLFTQLSSWQILEIHKGVVTPYIPSPFSFFFFFTMLKFVIIMVFTRPVCFFLLNILSYLNAPLKRGVKKISFWGLEYHDWTLQIVMVDVTLETLNM
ncbi:hypothetical protein K445DRAFT_266562 [Daldinia sp. EC12]|nr:hypothetical protein K445DRAFT_266562 [Daldinia sp. EC12]